jgi:hypothetical protein
LVADSALTDPTTGADAEPAVYRHAAKLVLLHGVTAAGHLHFGNQADRFADGRRVSLLDYGDRANSSVLVGPVAYDLLFDRWDDVVSDGVAINGRGLRPTGGRSV